MVNYKSKEAANRPVTINEFRDRVDTLVTKDEFRAEVKKLATRTELVAAVSKLATKDELKSEVSKLVSKDEFNKQVSRLDRRMEIIVGDAEDRMTGKLAESESRILRKMDRRFDDLMALIVQGMEHQESKFEDMIEVKLESLRA